MRKLKTLTYDVFGTPESYNLDGEIVTRIPYVKQYTNYYKIKGHYYA
jgi:hypothetical protein